MILVGHADERGPNDYNQALSERRAQLAKTFLTEQGVPAGNIETQAFGEERNLNSDEVKQSLEQNPDLSAEARQKVLLRMPTVVLAHNRRVDISLSTTGQESVRNYPFTAEDFSMLVRRGDATRQLVVPAAEKERIEN